MKWISLLIFEFFIINLTYAAVTSPDNGKKGIISPNKDGFVDSSVDYSKFTGRISDRDENGNIYKVQVENNNVKFFRAADIVYFTIGEKSEKQCKGTVKDVEKFHFVIYVEDPEQCVGKMEILRKGTIIKLFSTVLEERVYKASKFRKMLLQRKEDYLKQLSNLNHFMWTFDQQRVKLAAEYDQRILEVEKEKQKSMDDLLIKKEESALLQLTLQRTLDEIDEKIKHYKVERQELMTDRWHLDQDAGLPVGRRPQEIKKLY